MTDEQVFKLIEGMNDEDAIGIMWGACIDWYLGDKQGACVSIKSLPKLIGLIVEWKNHKLAQAIATARAEGANEAEIALARKVLAVANLKNPMTPKGMTMKKRLELLKTKMMEIIPDPFTIESLTTKEHHAS